MNELVVGHVSFGPAVGFGSVVGFGPAIPQYLPSERSALPWLAVGLAGLALFLLVRWS